MSVYEYNATTTRVLLLSNTFLGQYNQDKEVGGKHLWVKMTKV